MTSVIWGRVVNSHVIETERIFCHLTNLFLFLLFLYYFLTFFQVQSRFLLGTRQWRNISFNCEPIISILRVYIKPNMHQFYINFIIDYQNKLKISTVSMPDDMLSEMFGYKNIKAVFLRTSLRKRHKTPVNFSL